MTVTIIDAPCGAGKTTYAIQMMNKSIQEGDTKFIFMTPYLSEIKRIKAECPDCDFNEPTLEGGTKSGSFKKLLQEDGNIVSTHALFKLVDDEAIELLKMADYTLVLDESMDLLELVSITTSDLKILFDQGYITCDEDGAVRVTEASKDYSSGELLKYIIKARTGRLIYTEERLLLWKFPPEVFQVFKDVFILTYMFDSQIQRAYFDLYNIAYGYKTLDSSTGEHCPTKLTDDYDQSFKDKLRVNVNIYEGSLNDIGKAYNALSSGWYDNNVVKHPLTKDRLKKHMYNYFHNIVKAKSDETMWTCVNEYEKLLRVRGYAKGFVSCNARATNEYRDRKYLAYMINKYPLEPLRMYFQKRGITLDSNKYAISELIQWILRSQIRDDKPISLFLPSRRMRTLFNTWVMRCETTAK